MTEASNESPENCGSWPQRWAERRPDATAVVDAHHRLDWRHFEERIARLCGFFAERGLKRGDRVALFLSNGVPYLEIVMACARIGAIAVPINTRSTRSELEFVLEDAEPAILFHDAASDGDEIARGICEVAESVDRAASPARARLPFAVPVSFADEGRYADALAAADPEPSVADIDPSDAMILMYTSGTTGRPKGALLPHRKTHHNCLNAERYFGVRSSDRVLVPAPLFHSLGLKILSLPALRAGAALFIERRFDADSVWQTVAREAITYTGGVPTMYARLHDALETAERRGTPVAAESLRFLFTAGAAIPVDLIRAFEKHGLCLKQGYGQTETSILTCLDEADAVRKAGSVGRPVHHAELRLIDAESIEGPVEGWREVRSGGVGEIVVRGPITMTGYWRRPSETGEVLRDDGWLRTGDLATVDAEGFVTLVGRSRDMFISGGENVYPAEVEARYGEHPGVREIAVVGVSDERWGEVGHAFIVPASGTAPEEDALRRWGEERLARFKIPRRFTPVAELPRTASGKVQKHRLPTADPRGTSR